MKMTRAQLGIAVPLLNSYAHQYLGIHHGAIAIAGGIKGDECTLIVSADGWGEARPAEDFDAAKAMIDEFAAEWSEGAAGG